MKKMQLSQRVSRLKPSATLEVSAKAKAMRAEGIDVIGFGAGEPDLPTPDHICQAASDALFQGWTKYVASAGDPNAREAIARKFREENNLADMTAEHVVINAGAKMSLYLAIDALVDPGHEVIIQTPCWVSYAPMTGLADGTTVEIHTTAETNFKFGPNELRNALTEKSRVLILNSPSNPTGMVYSPDELKAIAEVINQHNREARERIAQGDDHACELIVLCDEIYEHLIYDDDLEFASIGQWIEEGCFVTINGLSKSHAMTGWRIGYAGCGRVELAKAMARLQSQMNTSITACCYPAIVEALENGKDDLPPMRTIYARRRHLMVGLVDDLPNVTCAVPIGAFYLFPDVSGWFGKTSPEGKPIRTAIEFADALLQEARVAVVPGDDFRGCGTHHIRLSYATSDENIIEGLRRIKAFLSGIT